MSYQNRLVRFMENHDEPRAAHEFPSPVHEAAAVVAYLTPGLRFFHEGQLEGRRIKVSMHLGRRPQEPPDQIIEDFYGRLLACLKHPEARSGKWRLLEVHPAWDGNPAWERFLAFTWEGEKDGRLLVIVNYSSSQGQCYVRLPPDGLNDGKLVFRDLMSEACYEREGRDLIERGLYLDLAGWGFHVFAW
jgi:hypothetical protein